MVTCCVSSCRNYYPKRGVSFFTFPKDPKMQKIWLQQCRRKDKFNIKNARICSKHFKADDYIRDLKSELLGLEPKYRLKPTAVPDFKPVHDFSVPLTTPRRIGSKIPVRHKRIPITKGKDNSIYSSKMPSMSVTPESLQVSPEPVAPMQMSKPIDRESVHCIARSLTVPVKDMRNVNVSKKKCLKISKSSHTSLCNNNQIACNDPPVASDNSVDLIPERNLNRNTNAANNKVSCYLNAFVREISAFSPSKTQTPSTFCFNQTGIIHDNLSNNNDAKSHKMNLFQRNETSGPKIFNENASDAQCVGCNITNDDSDIDNNLEIASAATSCDECSDNVVSNSSIGTNSTSFLASGAQSSVSDSLTNRAVKDISEMPNGQSTLEEIINYYRHKPTKKTNCEKPAKKVSEGVKEIDLNLGIRYRDCKIKYLEERVKKLLLHRKQLVSQKKHLRESFISYKKTAVGNIKKNLGKVFTPNQIHCLLTGKASSLWLKEDYERALALRKVVTKKAYNFLRNKMGYPLPCVSSIRKFKRAQQSLGQQSNSSNFDEIQEAIESVILHEAEQPILPEHSEENLGLVVEDEQPTTPHYSEENLGLADEDEQPITSQYSEVTLELINEDQQPMFSGYSEENLDLLSDVVVIYENQ